MAITGRTVRTPEKGKRLLGKLAQGYSVTAACRAEGIGRTTYYEWRDADADFAARADAAIEEGTDVLEDVARKRATAVLAGSDTLLIFLLKARRPDKYRDRQDVRHTGTVRHEHDALSAAVERVAAERGLDPADVLAEAEAIVAGGVG